MKDVLDQSQIDALFNDILGGKVELEKSVPGKQKKVTDYDFRIPKKVTKDQWRTLLSVFEIYSRHLSSYLTGTLRTYSQVEVSSIEETKYYEYANSLSETAMLGILNFNPIEGSVIMEFSKDLAFITIDKLLGGTGNSGIVADREYSDIEIALLERMYRNIIPFLRDAWTNVVDINPEFERFETKNGVSRMMHLNDIVVIIVLNVKVRNVTGSVTICIPYDSLDSINDKLSVRYRVNERAKNALDAKTTKQSIFSQMNKSGVDVTAVLGETTVYLRDLLNLEPGDVIRLNRKQQDLAKLTINNKTWFYGRLGVLNNIKAVEIVKSVE